MKKSTKLLSVLLAVLMIFSSMSIMTSALQYDYKKVDTLKNLNAYGTTDSVTRLNSDARADMVLDFLDGVLLKANIKVDLSILGKLDLTSIDNALTSIAGLSGLLGTFGWLIGDLGGLKLDAIKKNKTSRRANTIDYNGTNTAGTYTGLDVLVIVVNLINDNRSLIKTILTKGQLKAGLVGSFVDLSMVDTYLSDLSGLIKGFIYPLFSRPDDNQTRVAELADTSASLDATINKTITKVFTDRQDTVTYKEDINGNPINNCVLPTKQDDDKDNLREYYVSEGTGATKAFMRYTLNEKTNKWVIGTEIFRSTEEPAGSGEYVFKDVSGETLKYYKNDGYWLPSLQAALTDPESGFSAASLDVTTVTPLSLLYTFIPYVFKDMAPVVLNGSVKMLLAEWLGATKTELTEEQITALKASEDENIKAFFNKDAGKYIWEWSDYLVANDQADYYRIVSKDGKKDQFFVLNKNTANELFNMFNFNWNITDDFFNEFIPSSSTSSASMILLQLNNILYKAVNTLFTDEMITKIGWTKGDNTQIVPNLRKAIKAILPIAPEYILGTGYNTSRYAIIMDDTKSDKQVAANLVALIIEQAAPQFILPAQINSLGEVAAVCVRELLTQLLPSANYDDLIYTNYNTRTLRSGEGIDDKYWIDVVLTMGVDVGVFYLGSIADLNCDVCDFTKTWTYDEFVDDRGYDNQYWEMAIDYIVDWALTDDDGATGAWKISNLVNVAGLDINMADSDQDPWKKIDQILYSILPIGDILNVTPKDASTTKLEQALRYDLVYGLLDLDLSKIIGLLQIPDTSVLRTTATVPAVIEIVRNLLNAILKATVVPTTVGSTDIVTLDSVLAKDTLIAIVDNLLGALYTNRVGILKTVLPFLNWFVGWSSNDQTFKAPEIIAPRFSYITSGHTTDSISVKNDANGMFRRYTDGNGNYAYDNHYVVEVTNVVPDNSKVTMTTTTGTINAGETLDFGFSVAGLTGMEPVKYTISYKVKSATGEYINDGAVYSVDAYSYITDRDSDENVVGTAAKGTVDSYGNPEDVLYDKDYVNLIAHNMFYFTTSVASTAEAIQVQLKNISVVGGDKQLDKIYFDKTENNWNAACDSYFQFFSELDRSTFAKKEIRITRLFEVKPDADRSAIPDGFYDFGRVSVRTQQGYNYDCSIDIYQYDDFKIKDVMNSYLDKKLTRAKYMAGSEADTAWAVYSNALFRVCNLVNQPYFMSNFETAVANNIENAIKTLDTKFKALKPYELDTTADTLALATEVLDTIKDAGGVDYQDVLFYRYVKYESALKEVESIKASVTAPAAPENRIENSSLKAEQINEILDGITDVTLRGYLEGTVIEPTPKEDEDYQEVLEEFNKSKPNPNKIDVAIAAENLTLNFDRLLDKARDDQFLVKEIAAATAANYVEANYTEKSYAKYKKALTEAQALVADKSSKQSDMFEAKYNLMVAQKNLLLKADSAEQNGDYLELDSYIEQANTILDNLSMFEVTDGSGLTKDQAISKLYEGLGYTVEYDIDEDGDLDEVQLFEKSALALRNSDLMSSFANTMKIDEAVANIRKAVKNFVVTGTTIPDPPTPDPDPDPSLPPAPPFVDVADKVVKGLTPGKVSKEDIESSVLGTAPANSTVTTTPSKSNKYGTGTVVTQTTNGIQTAVYTVVIYGDVNGDGVIDAVDVFELNRAFRYLNTLTNAYFDAGDNDTDGVLSDNDYANLKLAALKYQSLNQLA